MQIIRQQNARKLHFFDYSLWNHYVKDLSMPLLSAASALSFCPHSCRAQLLYIFGIFVHF